MSIGALVARLIAAGTPAEVAAEVVAEAFAAGAGAAPGRVVGGDPAAERRRAYDRERKRLTRDQRLPESDWLDLVGRVLTRDGHRCQYCGDKGGLTADHVVPMSRGGTHDMHNLVACCLPCNTKKSNKLLCEWLPDPRKSAGQEFVSDAARDAIIRETSAEIRGTPRTQNAVLIEEVVKKDVSHETVRTQRKKKSADIPADWEPKVAHFEAAEALGMSRQAVLDKAQDMRIWAQGKGEQRADWDATFHGFIRRDAKQLAGRAPPGTQPSFNLDPSVRNQPNDRTGPNRNGSRVGPRAVAQDALVAGMAAALSERPDSRLYAGHVRGWGPGEDGGPDDPAKPGAIAAGPRRLVGPGG